MIRYYWTFVVGFLLLVFIGVPAIAVGHILRKFFGVIEHVHDLIAERVRTD